MTPLTEHDEYVISELKRKGFGAWEDDDLDAWIKLEESHPEVRARVLPRTYGPGGGT